MTVLEKILEDRIIAIVRGIPSSQIESLAEALCAGGIHCIEVTFDQSSPEKLEDTAKSIKIINEKFAGRVLAGAGTVMSVEQVRMAAEAGALYMISPNVNRDVIRETKALGLVSIPGAMTPSEAAEAYEAGADVVKIFPAGQFGPGYIKAIKAPLKHIPFAAVGGVNVGNCAEFISAGCCCVGCGGNLVSAKLISEGRFAEITALAADYIKALHAQEA
jgi:2-dehydro-3-deoxyphosphogluconate aldolase/(4S)-4-hydroxy-2-oxoglutarate aldolase